ncbi:MAG: TatD family hydrolase [Candidatus Nezhaarchaeales archaeon]
MNAVIKKNTLAEGLEVLGLKLIDTHVHLEEVVGLNEALRRALEAGVVAVITMGSDLESCRFALEVSARRNPVKVYPALGLHPWSLLSMEKVDEALSFISRNLDYAVGVGEIGLDHWIKAGEEVKEKQLQVFLRLLELAKDSGKPAIIHSRGAWSSCLKAVKQIGVKKAVFHWFSGPLNVLQELLESGYYLSATPAVEYGKEHRAAVKAAPLDRLMLETDSPVAYRGVKAEPSHLVKTLKGVAEVKGLSVEEVAVKTFEASLRFFELNL